MIQIYSVLLLMSCVIFMINIDDFEDCFNNQLTVGNVVVILLSLPAIIIGTPILFILSLLVMAAEWVWNFKILK